MLVSLMEKVGDEMERRIERGKWVRNRIWRRVQRVVGEGSCTSSSSSLRQVKVETCPILLIWGVDDARLKILKNERKTSNA